MQSLSRGLLKREGSYGRISCTLRSSRRLSCVGDLEIQLAGSYELVELPLKRVFHIGVPGQCFCRLRQSLQMELERLTTAELSDQLRNTFATTRARACEHDCPNQRLRLEI